MRIGLIVTIRFLCIIHSIHSLIVNRKTFQYVQSQIIKIWYHIILHFMMIICVVITRFLYIIHSIHSVMVQSITIFIQNTSLHPSIWITIFIQNRSEILPWKMNSSLKRYLKCDLLLWHTCMGLLIQHSNISVGIDRLAPRWTLVG